MDHRHHGGGGSLARAPQDHPHWNRARWIPYVSPPVRARDIAGNFALYVPFGFLYARGRPIPAVFLRGLAYAVLLSTGTEFTQLFSHQRFPSVQDVLMNVLGAAGGMAIVRVSEGTRVGTMKRR
jgi:glycopeptide antibiotics resistance protein